MLTTRLWQRRAYVRLRPEAARWKSCCTVLHPSWNVKTVGTVITSDSRKSMMMTHALQAHGGPGLRRSQFIGS